MEKGGSFMDKRFIDKRDEDLIQLLKKGEKAAGLALYSRYKAGELPFVSQRAKDKEEDQFITNLSHLEEEHLQALHQFTNWSAPSYFLRLRYQKDMKNLNEEQLMFLVQCSSKEALNILISQQTDYYEASDEMLVLMSQKGDFEAAEILIERFVPFVKKVIRRLERKFFFRGFDTNDLIQEGVLGLFKSKDDYKIERKTKFKDFSKHVIEKHIGTLILRSSNYKNKVLNESFSYHSPIGSDSEITFEQLLKSDSYHPEDMLMKKESYEDISEKLTELEQKVLKLYAKGLSYEEIGEIVGKKKKAIDNTIQRIRKKGKSYRNQQLNPENWSKDFNKS